MARRVRWPQVAPRLPVRAATAHKGRFGHVLVVAGDRGYGGAGLLAAEAAVRCGAGLVSLATRPEHVTAMLARCPAVMVQGVTHGSQLTPLLEAATVIVCGPGLGRGAWGQQMLQQVISTAKPRVLDADALNLLAQRAPVHAACQVLTPHPGEAARLLGQSVSEVEANRVQAVQALQHRYGGTVLLKGAGTLVASAAEVPAMVTGSNPGLASGGMGDVLSGMVGALLAQVREPGAATEIAAALHLACAGRAAAKRGFMGLIATDIIDTLPQLLGEAEGVVVNHETGFEEYGNDDHH
nr:NAD(P)H-hydrate dehydratase [Marinobacter sp. X15-166B]